MDEQTDRRRPITAAQWLHARAVSEGAPPTRDRIAGMLDCNVTAVYEHARAEGWKRLDFRRAEVRQAHADFIELAGLDLGPWQGGAGSAAAVPGGGASGGEAGDGAAPAQPETGPDTGRHMRRDLRRDIGAGGEGSNPDASRGDAPPGRRDGAAAEAGAGDPVELMGRGTALLARRLNALLERAERGGRLDKAEFDGLAAMARMIERWGTMAQDQARHDEKHSDEELAAIYRRIDGRIVELAREEAGRLVEAGHPAATGARGG